MGDREAHIRWCLRELPRKGIRVTQISQIYETFIKNMSRERHKLSRIVTRFVAPHDPSIAKLGAKGVWRKFTRSDVNFMPQQERTHRQQFDVAFRK